jgi:hypothetical protein
LYWSWWSRGSCSSSRWCNLACCGKLTRVWKWVTLRTPICLTKQLDSASARLGFRFAGIQTNGPKLALIDSEICCGQPNKMQSMFLARFMRPRSPSASAQGAQKGLHATNRALIVWFTFQIPRLQLFLFFKTFFAFIIERWRSAACIVFIVGKLYEDIYLILLFWHINKLLKDNYPSYIQLVSQENMRYIWSLFRL